MEEEPPAPSELPDRDRASPIFVIAGFNGHATARTWASLVKRHAPSGRVVVFPWFQAQRAATAIMHSGVVTLVGHSLGGGCAEIMALTMPPGKIGTLVTVAPYAPWDVDTQKVRERVGRWINIVSAPCWRDRVTRLAAMALPGWRDQGRIPSASENFVSRFPHHDFYQLISERWGEAGPV